MVLYRCIKFAFINKEFRILYMVRSAADHVSHLRVQYQTVLRLRDKTEPLVILNLGENLCDFR